MLLDGKRREAVAPLAEALQTRQMLLWEHSPDIVEARKFLEEARRD